MDLRLSASFFTLAQLRVVLTSVVEVLLMSDFASSLPFLLLQCAPVSSTCFIFVCYCILASALGLAMLV